MRNAFQIAKRRTLMATPNSRDRDPIWWIKEYTVIWEEAEPSPRNVFERRFHEQRREQEKQQGPDNAVIGRSGVPRQVDVEHAYLVPDQDWETGLS
jgi:hypothetical protein